VLKIISQVSKCIKLFIQYRIDINPKEILSSLMEIENKEMKIELFPVIGNVK